MELAVVKLDCANVLLAALHGFNFTVALNLFCGAGYGYRQPEGEYDQQEHDPDEEVALFGAVYAAVWNVAFH